MIAIVMSSFNFSIFCRRIQATTSHLEPSHITLSLPKWTHSWSGMYSFRYIVFVHQKDWMLLRALVRYYFIGGLCDSNKWCFSCSGSSLLKFKRLVIWVYLTCMLSRVLKGLKILLQSRIVFQASPVRLRRMQGQQLAADCRLRARFLVKTAGKAYTGAADVRAMLWPASLQQAARTRLASPRLCCFCLMFASEYSGKQRLRRCSNQRVSDNAQEI